MSLAFSTGVEAQTGSTKKEAAAPDTSPLARYAPRENLFFYAEFSGLNSHLDAWRKTAAYKMLNETTLGVMLEDVGAQLAERALKEAPDRRITGSEAVKLLEHFAQSGVVLGAASLPDQPAKGLAFVVFRGAARKEISGITGRLLISMGDPAAKPELSKRASGRQVVVMKRAQGGSTWAWWAEKEDVVIALNGPEGADAVAEVLDGKRPNAIEHPIRAELEQPENGMEPVGLGFFDPAAMKVSESPLSTFFDQVRQSGIERFDYRWGLAGDALMSVARLKSPAPRKGLLALLDQPTFDKKSMPPMPEGVTTFTAVSLKPAELFDVVSAKLKAANPAAGEAIDKAVETLRTKTRLQLRKDVLAHLGPKALFYTAPTAAPAATAKTATNGTGANASAGAGGLNPVGMLLGTATLPKFVVMIEIDDKAAFERTLDSLVIQANKEIRALMQAKAAEAEAATAPAPGAEAGPDNLAPGGDQPTRRPETVPTPEFKMMPGPVKSYVLNVPSGLGRLPAGLRPTIRVGAKHVVIASSPEVARQALEVKKEASWIPADEFATAIEQVPDHLVYLHLDDPREQMPKLLAGLPGELQKRINTAQITAGLTSAAGAPGTPAADPASATAAAAPGAPADPALAPGLANPPGIPGPPGGPAAAGAEGAEKPVVTPFVIRVDPAKLPSDTALKALLFPGTAAASVTDQEFRFVRRVAFPNLISRESLADKVMTAMLKPWLESVTAAAAKRVGQPGGSASTSATSGGNAPAGGDRR